MSEELNVEVISCFETNLLKPNLYMKSFRLCINARDNDKLLDPDSWVDGIIIKAWKFADRNRRTTMTSHSDNHVGERGEHAGQTRGLWAVGS